MTDAFVGRVTALFRHPNQAVRDFAVMVAAHTCRRVAGIVDELVSAIEHFQWQDEDAFSFPHPFNPFGYCPYRDFSKLRQSRESVEWALHLLEVYSEGGDDGDRFSRIRRGVYQGLVERIVASAPLELLRPFDERIETLARSYPRLGVLRRRIELEDLHGESRWDALQSLLRKQRAGGQDETEKAAVLASLASLGPAFQERARRLLREEEQNFRQNPKPTRRSFLTTIELVGKMGLTEMEDLLLRNLRQPDDLEEVAVACREALVGMLDDDDFVERVYRRYTEELDRLEAVDEPPEDEEYERAETSRRQLAAVLAHCCSRLAVRRALTLFGREIVSVPPRQASHFVTTMLLLVFETNLAIEAVDAVRLYLRGFAFDDREDHHNCIREFLLWCAAIDVHVPEEQAFLGELENE